MFVETGAISSSGVVAEQEYGSSALLELAWSRRKPPHSLAHAELALGWRNGCAIGATGTLACWGQNDHGQLQRHGNLWGQNSVGDLVGGGVSGDILSPTPVTW